MVKNIDEYVNKIHCGDWIEVLKTLPSKIFHCCVCSPPYWGQRDYNCEGQLGLEKTPEEHIEKLVEGFREVRRVLRDDGVLWLNYGDKYWGGKGQSAHGGSDKQRERFERDESINKEYQEIGRPGWTAPGDGKHETLKAGDLMMLPARVALALQADGWILRDDVIWAKAISFNDKYSGSTMPESVNGWRWERCRVKVSNWDGSKAKNKDEVGNRNTESFRPHLQAQYQDCPGCPKCEKNGGLILRRGSWRCTKAHEHLFQFVKTNDYFCDMEAVKEDYNYDGRKDTTLKPTNKYGSRNYGQSPNSCHVEGAERWPGSGRNLRNVWTINPRGYKEAHYATYPEALVEPCIKVSTSQKGVCPKCGAQWARVVDSKAVKRNRPNDKTDRHNQGNGVNSCGNTVAGVDTTTLGWKATCQCGLEETVPALVADVFAGSGTTLVVAAKLGRNYFGIEINPDYKENHIDKRVKEAETGVPATEARAGQGALFE